MRILSVTNDKLIDKWKYNLRQRLTLKLLHKLVQLQYVVKVAEVNVQLSD